jgi:CDP-diacylglycerol--glycerol-3-phosphate 3-phosphatidyltransferase
VSEVVLAEADPKEFSQSQSAGSESEKHYGPGAIVTVANVITFGRAAALPLLFYLMFEPGRGAAWGAFALWVVLGISDTLDGIVARRLGPTTSGAYLDPLADKLQVIGALTILWLHAKLSWVPLSMIVAREVAVSGLRSVAARRGVSIPATPFGKVKTLTQMVAVGLFLLPPAATTPGPAIIVLWIAVGFTLASGLDYIWRGLHVLSKPATSPPPPDSGSLDEALEPVISAIREKDPFMRKGNSRPRHDRGGASGGDGDQIIPLRLSDEDASEHGRD